MRGRDTDKSSCTAGAATGECMMKTANTGLVRLTCWTTAAAATASIITANPGPGVSPIIASSSQRRSVRACGRRGERSSVAGDRSTSLAFVGVERAKPTSASRRARERERSAGARRTDSRYCCCRVTAARRLSRADRRSRSRWRWGRAHGARRHRASN